MLEVESFALKAVKANGFCLNFFFNVPIPGIECQISVSCVLINADHSMVCHFSL